MFWANDRAAIWSPYYYITIDSPTPDSPAISEPVSDLQTRSDHPLYVVKVNHDFYQVDSTLRRRRYTPGSAAAQLAIYHQETVVNPILSVRGPRSRSGGGGRGGSDVQSCLADPESSTSTQLKSIPCLSVFPARFNSRRAL